MTLEEAQAQIIEQKERITELEMERDSLSEKNKTLTEDNERIRTLNQKYFEKLSMQKEDPENHNQDNEPDTPSCEEFAKTLFNK